MKDDDQVIHKRCLSEQGRRREKLRYLSQVSPCLVIALTVAVPPGSQLLEWGYGAFCMVPALAVPW